MPDVGGPLAGCRVLVVEDEYLIAIEIARWLQEAGVAVIGPAPSVEPALDLIEDEAAPDAAVLDINLGGGETVFPVVDRLAALRVPFLFATGDVRSRDDPRYGARPRLVKPVIAPELLRALRELAKARPSKAAHRP